MRRTTGLVGPALVLVLLTSSLQATFAGAQEPQPSVSIRLAESPTDPKVDPLAQYYIVDHVKPGEKSTAKVGVGVIGGTAPIDVDIYVGAARIDDGQFIPEGKETESDLTSWATVEPGRASVAPGTETPVAVTIAVPADAPSGEHYGAVFAELPPGGGDTNVVNRVGIRIYLTVGEGKAPKTDFEIAAVTAGRDKDKRPIVETRVRNTGERAVVLTGELKLEEGPGGLTTKPYNIPLGTSVAPGESAPVQAVLDAGLPDGPWKATVTIRSGRLEKTASATITFPDEADSRSEAVPVDDNATERKILGPVAGVLAAAGLAASAVALRKLRVRRRRPS